MRRFASALAALALMAAPLTAQAPAPVDGQLTINEAGFLTMGQLTINGFLTVEDGFLTVGQLTINEEGFLTMDEGFLTMDEGFLTMDEGFLTMDEGFLTMDEGFLTVGFLTM